jgi:hypothetical protein
MKVNEAEDQLVQNIENYAAFLNAVKSDARQLYGCRGSYFSLSYNFEDDQVARVNDAAMEGTGVPPVSS